MIEEKKSAKSRKKISESSNDRELCYNGSMKEKIIQENRQLNKKQLERIIIIHNAIKAGLYPDNKKLRSLYCETTGYENVGEATIQRSIEVLRAYFNAPIEYDRRKGGFYYSNKFELKLNNISPQEVFYLSAAKTMLASFKGTHVYDSISDVIDFVTDTQGVGKSNLLKRIAVPPVPRIVTKDKSVWNKILDSLQDNHIIEFDYNGRWNAETTHRRIHPYQLLFDNGRCFIFGYSEERKDVRIFSLNRITNLIISDDTFKLPDDYEFSDHCGGGRFGAFIGDDPTTFVIDFYGDAREYIKEFIWADDQKIEDFDEEDKTRITLTTRQILPVKELILSQGANAVPVEPEWFVNEWKEVVEEMAENAGVFSS